MRPPTPKQAAVLGYMRMYFDEHERVPTYEQIRDHFGFKSPNDVTQNLRALERKGYLSRTDAGWTMHDMCPTCGQAMGRQRRAA